ncbi:MAG: hypothetical protein J5957_12740 [Prevotella sp.]|nr:hypothetical protein [Prevotella sp.]
MKLYNILDMFISSTGKIMLCLLVGFFVLCSISLFFLPISDYLFPKLNGSYNLGNGIYMIEWDDGRIIVNGEQIIGNTCYGGSPLIPSIRTAIDSADYTYNYERVVKVKSDREWIIAKTHNHQNGQEIFYIIDKGFDINKTTAEDIVNNYIHVYSDSISFAKACNEKKIGIFW